MLCRRSWYVAKGFAAFLKNILCQGKAIIAFLVLLPVTFHIGCMTTMIPLMSAAQAGQTTTAQALLDAGADVNEKDDIGWTALMFAARNGYNATVQTFIDAGADVNVKDENGNTALMAASGYGDIATVKALLGAGAIVNTENNNGQTALMWATTTISLCYPDIAQALLDAGANNSETALRLLKERKQFVIWLLDCDYEDTEVILKKYGSKTSIAEINP